MKIIAAYLLAVLGGNKNPDKAAIDKILGSVGIEVEGNRVKLLIEELSGKSLEEVIEAGKKKLAVTSIDAVEEDKEGKEKETTEEKEEEEQDESDGGVSINLFGGSDEDDW